MCKIGFIAVIIAITFQGAGVIIEGGNEEIIAWLGFTTWIIVATILFTGAYILDKLRGRSDTISH